MKRRYRLTPEAKRDLLESREYIARDDVRAAQRMLGRIEAAFQMLARSPKVGHKRQDVKTSMPVLFWPAGSYVIVYAPEPKPIVIVRVVHGARDLDALL